MFQRDIVYQKLARRLEASKQQKTQEALALI